MNKNELRYASGVLLATRDGRYEQPFPAVFVAAHPVRFAENEHVGFELDRWDAKPAEYLCLTPFREAERPLREWVAAGARGEPPGFADMSKRVKTIRGTLGTGGVVAGDDAPEGWRFQLAPSRRFVGRYAVVMSDWLALTA